MALAECQGEPRHVGSPPCLRPPLLSSFVPVEQVAGTSLTYDELAKECTNPRLLFKQCIHPAFPDG